MTEFVSDRTSSNRAGVTLMNNQVGYVVADVMRDKEDVTVTELPVDDPRRRRQQDRLRLRGDRRGARAGTTSATTTSKRSCRTHYGRMVVLDDRVLLFANPEDAAEYIGFDLQPSSRRSCMYEKDGEKYFIFDSHLHFWDASPANWKPGAEEYAKGWIECFHAYQGLGPPETHWTIEHFQKYSVEDFEKDVFIDGCVDKAVFQSTYLKEWYTNGLQRHRAERGAARALPGQADRQRPLGPA